LTVNGTANMGANVTTTGAQTYTGAVTLSGGARTLTGASINTQSTLAGGNNALTIAGAADMDGEYTGLSSLSITGAANIGANVTTAGAQTYGGAVTLSSNVLVTATNSPITFDQTIDGDGMLPRALDVRTGGTVTFERSIGSLVPLQGLSTVAVPPGSYSPPAGKTLVGSGAGSVRTTGDQVYGNLEIRTNSSVQRDADHSAVVVNTEEGGTTGIYPLRLSSTAGALNFLGVVEGGVGAKTAKRSLFLEAATQVKFNNLVGFDAVTGRNGNVLANYTRHYGIYRLDVTAPEINILGNISTYEHMNFRGQVFIGGHTGQAETRYLLSLDPAVNFFGKVDGYGLVEGLYTLDARAIGFDVSITNLSQDHPGQPVVNFASDVGSSKALASLNVQAAVVGNMQGLRGGGADTIGGVGARQQSAVAAPIEANAGTLRFSGNLTTTGGQSHFANRIVVSGGGPRGNEFNGTSFDLQLGTGGIVNAEGGRPRIRFSTNPSGETLRQLQRAGVTITSMPSDATPESVMAQQARNKHAAHAFEEALDAAASTLPSVEIGDLEELPCDKDANDQCKIRLPVRLSGKN
jgi:hypothetical protein